MQRAFTSNQSSIAYEKLIFNDKIIFFEAWENFSDGCVTINYFKSPLTNKLFSINKEMKIPIVVIFLSLHKSWKEKKKKKDSQQWVLAIVVTPAAW